MTRTTRGDEEDVFRDIIRKSIANMHTGMPGVIDSYDASGPKANIRLGVRSTFQDPVTGELSSKSFTILPNVPIKFQQAQGSSMGISLNLERGDTVWVEFAERSIDRWLQTGGVDVEPGDPRRFDTSDAIAYPGLAPHGVFSNVTTDGIKFGQHGTGNDASVRVTEAGKIGIGTSTDDVLQAVWIALNALTTATAGLHPGPFDGPTITKLELARDAIGAIKT